jgi:hypothetical protein
MIPRSLKFNSLFRLGLIQKKALEITWIQGDRRVCKGVFPQNPLKIPVLIPDTRESGWESGLLRTASTASKSTRNSYPFLLPAKLVKIPIKSGY